MHRCIGNDDLENKKIYEESVQPEGIRKTIAVKEKRPAFDFSKIQKQVPIKNKNMGKIKTWNTKKENKVVQEIVTTIVFLVFFLLFLFLIMS